MAQEQKTGIPVASESYDNDFQGKRNESKDAGSDKIFTSWFIRNPIFVNYNFNQKQISYTQAISSGFGIDYNKAFIELGAFIDKDNNYGYYTLFGSRIHVKNLDEDWKSAIIWFGEITYFQIEQINSDLWIYTAGMAVVVARPFKWGTTAIVFCAGGAYGNKEISLNTRAFFNLSIPIF